MMRDDRYKGEKNKVETYYTNKNFLKRIDSILERTGKNINSLTVEDLEPFEDLHLRGREATKELLVLLKPNDSSKVLDVGCGIGGTSRYISYTYKSNVTGIDLSAENIHIAKELSRLVGLENSIIFKKGDATALPFDNNMFDIAISQHIQMSIPDKRKYIEEVFRVLKHGGKFGIYEIFKNGSEPLDYPVPWAEDKSISFLVSWEIFKELLHETGFKEEFERDTSETGLMWSQPIVERINSSGQQPFGVDLFMGDTAKAKLNNFLTNLKDNRIRVMQAVYVKG